MFRTMSIKRSRGLLIIAAIIFSTCLLAGTATANAGTLSLSLFPSKQASSNQLLSVNSTLTVCDDSSVPSWDASGNFVCKNGTPPSPNPTSMGLTGIYGLYGLTTQLQQAKYPYTNFVTVDNGIVDDNGSYALTALTDFTSHYRVVVPDLGMTSPVVSLRVASLVTFYQFHLSFSFGPSKVPVKGAASFQVPPSVKLGGVRAVW